MGRITQYDRVAMFCPVCPGPSVLLCTLPFSHVWTLLWVLVTFSLRFQAECLPVYQCVFSLMAWLSSFVLCTPGVFVYICVQFCRHANC